ncbi:MAG: sugar ABC transporter permease [Clostridia bacterium]|nr:sugar ABC transporter permease [Clostridia bacterium]
MERTANDNGFWPRIRPYVFILPAMVFLALFVIYPIGDLAVRSFQKWDLIGTPTWVNTKNFEYIFKRKEFIDSLWHTGIYALCLVGLGLPISMLFAVWLSKSTRLNNLLRSVMFMPHVISLLSVAMVWAWIMNKDNGLLNMALGVFGIGPLQWFDSSDTALMSVIIVATWKAVGYNTMLIYAAMQNVPTELYEAADLDNASRISKFFKITFPMISPQMFMLLITATTGSFKVFETVRVLTKGGPGTSTQVLVYYIYKQAFYLNKVGYAAAAGVVLMGIMGVMTIIYFWALSKKVHYQ